MMKNNNTQKFDWEYFRDAGMVFFKEKNLFLAYNEFLRIVGESKIEMSKFRKRMEEMEVIEKFKQAIVQKYKSLFHLNFHNFDYSLKNEFEVQAMAILGDEGVEFVKEKKCELINGYYMNKLNEFLKI